MKRIAIVLVALALVASLVSAQDTTPKTKAGDRAWMFSFSGLSNLGANAYMGGVGGKYYFQDDLALRAGIGFSSTNIPDVDNDPSSWNLNAGLQYNYAQTGPVVAYFGGQVMYGSSKATGATDADTQFGIAGLAGVEWFPYTSISLGAEYALSFISQKDGASDKSTSFINLGSSGGALTLSVYF